MNKKILLSVFPALVMLAGNSHADASDECNAVNYTGGYVEFKAGLTMMSPKGKIENNNTDEAVDALYEEFATPIAEAADQSEDDDSDESDSSGGADAAPVVNVLKFQTDYMKARSGVMLGLVYGYDKKLDGCNIVVGGYLEFEYLTSKAKLPATVSTLYLTDVLDDEDDEEDTTSGTSGTSGNDDPDDDSAGYAVERNNSDKLVEGTMKLRYSIGVGAKFGILIQNQYLLFAKLGYSMINGKYTNPAYDNYDGSSNIPDSVAPTSEQIAAFQANTYKNKSIWNNAIVFGFGITVPIKRNLFTTVGVDTKYVLSGAKDFSNAFHPKQTLSLRSSFICTPYISMTYKMSGCAR